MADLLVFPRAEPDVHANMQALVESGLSLEALGLVLMTCFPSRELWGDGRLALRHAGWSRPKSDRVLRELRLVQGGPSDRGGVVAYVLACLAGDL